MSRAADIAAERQAQNRRADAEIGEYLGEYIREQPLKSLAMAGAAGFILGGGANSRMGVAMLAMAGRIALRGAATNLITGLIFPKSTRATGGRGKYRRKDRDERNESARHHNGRTNFRNPG